MLVTSINENSRSKEAADNFVELELLAAMFLLLYNQTWSVKCGTWGPFLETPDNFPDPKTILGAQYSPIPIQFLFILKAKF